MGDLVVAFIAFVGALTGAMAPALLNRRDRRLHARQEWVAQVLESHRELTTDALFADFNDRSTRWGYTSPDPKPPTSLLTTDALRADAVYEYWSVTLKYVLLLHNTDGWREAQTEGELFRVRATKWARGTLPIDNIRRHAKRVQAAYDQRAKEHDITWPF